MIRYIKKLFSVSCSIKSSNDVLVLGKNQEGVILVLSLIIISILFSTALGFAMFIISDIKQAQEIDNATVAYYAAEAGIERSLFLIKKTEIDFINTGDGDTLIEVLGEDGKDLGKANWNISHSTDYEENFIRRRLYNGQSVKLYFLNRNENVILDDKNETEHLGIKWSKSSLSDSRLQVIFTQLNPQLTEDGVLIYYTDQNLRPQLSEVDGCFNFQDEVLPNCEDGCLNRYDYVVELKSLCVNDEDLGNCDDTDFIENLKVRAYSGTGCQEENLLTTGITNITIHSIGTYRNVQQEILAYIPPRDPISGILSFVLFSEEDITKDY